MGKGYMGKVLFVDLSDGSWKEEKIPDKVYEEYLSGVGLAARLLYDRIPAGADPLGPDNILGFVSGLLTGTGSFFTGRWMAVGKSPLTGGWGDANCGGNFSPAIKKAGYDGIFVKGAAREPVYLLVNDGKAEIKSAAHLWGKDTVETEKLLIEEAGIKNARVACIGPAGERRSLISGISNDRGRMAARSGLGAVMGSKKLKAVVCGGSAKVEVHDRDKIKELSAHCNRYVKRDIPLPPGNVAGFLGVVMRLLPAQMGQDGLLYKSMLKKWGTSSMNQISIEIGDAPIKNWSGSNVDFPLTRSRSVNPRAIAGRETSKYRCYSCPLGCGGICKGAGKFEETHKPEYETTIALGGLLLNENADSIFYLNELLNRAGMDTISAGATVAFAIECFEHGILTKDDTDGIELAWGNCRAVIALIEKMIAREGIGDILADGSRLAAERIDRRKTRPAGAGSAGQYAMHAGGQDLPMHDGRNDPGFAVHYVVEPTPGRHTIGAQLYYEMYQLWKEVKGLPDISLLYGKDRKYDTDRVKAVMAAACSRYNQVYNGAGLCMFGAFIGAGRLPLFGWLNAATGWDRTPGQYMDIGGRIQTLRQAFNVKHGIEPSKVAISRRALGIPPQKEGANKGRSVDLDPVVSDYWEEFGWDPGTGVPKET
jgi:aldehyde:ferredoxin oxidoreductase